MQVILNKHFLEVKNNTIAYYLTESKKMIFYRMKVK